MRHGSPDVFDRAAGRYGEGNPLLVVERPALESLLPTLRGLCVLDLGSGPGHYAELARAQGARLAVALDLSPAMLAVAPSPRICGNGEALPLAASSFDVVVAALVLSHTGRPACVLAEIARVLRPAGVAVLSEIHPVAEELGWERTFRGGDGKTLRASSRPLRAEHWRVLLADAPWVLEAWAEPSVGASLEGEFRRAGRSDFERLRGTPLLVTARVRRGVA